MKKFMFRPRSGYKLNLASRKFKFSMNIMTIQKKIFLPSAKPHGQQLGFGVRRGEEDHFKKINFYNYVSSTFDSWGKKEG